MHPGTSTAVASRSVRTVTSLEPERGVKVSSPTTEWSLARAWTVHDGWWVPDATVTSTWAVTLCSSTTWKVTSSDSTFGVAWTKVAQASQPSATAASTAIAAIVTGRRHAGGAAYRSVRAWSTRSM